MACKRLQGKVAIVTASSTGIGYAIAQRLAQEGASVVISSRKQKNVDEAVAKLKSQNLKAVGMTCHVGKEEDRQKLINETVKIYGGIDIFVSNAAINPVFGPFLDTTEAVWDKIMDTNVKATFMMCKSIVPHMEQRGGGSIILVSSIGGYVAEQMLGAYAISKTAMLGLTKVLAVNLTDKNIRVNCLAPGLIKTNFSEALWNNPAVYDIAIQRVPMQRIGQPEECAGTAAFLASSDSSYMTGETVVVAGGSHARL